ncbi:MAG: DUF1673 domain-containing protein [Methanosarcina sp.]|nr:DUF1673 domain-containing protein [Methanosarcina sp.]MDD3873100.1 DUF1673 domain-containing protein [Methanosarcina sp.]MDD4521648.1 DUF1673 domain-containing protein [Methanosarcina sp.]HHV24460.1 DUF1673 domain-containing protein [Methanosarcina sp.]
MNGSEKFIKKLMGWCPNVRAHEARQHINLENFESDIPDRVGGENGDLKNFGWLRKTSIQTLLINTFLTLGYFLVINHLGLNLILGINLILLLAGSFISLSVIILYWKAQMKRYDALVKYPVIDYSNKEKLYSALSYVFILIFILLIKGHEAALQATFSFMGGFMIGMWLSYFQLIYWEKKNHKTIYFNKSYGTWKKSYIIQEKK